MVMDIFNSNSDQFLKSNSVYLEKCLNHSLLLYGQVEKKPKWSDRPCKNVVAQKNIKKTAWRIIVNQ